MATLDEGDERLLQALASGDEQVVARLVDAWSEGLRRIASIYVGTRALSEEVVQEAWLTVLRSISTFERRSSLHTWVTGIVVNVARSRARAERRAHPRGRAAAGSADEQPLDDRPHWPQHWSVPKRPWGSPEEHLLAGEARRVLMAAIAALPLAQRAVIVRRDLLGLSATEVCSTLGLSDTHQRVLLHRARLRVRQSFEHYLKQRPIDRSLPVARCGVDQAPRPRRPPRVRPAV